MATKAEQAFESWKAAEGQPANRAPGAVDHGDTGGQQISHSITGEGMSVTTAKLHEGIAPTGLQLAGNGRPQPPGQGAIAEFIHLLHGGANSPPVSMPASRIRARVWAASSGSSLARAKPTCTMT